MSNVTIETILKRLTDDTEAYAEDLDSPGVKLALDNTRRELEAGDTMCAFEWLLTANRNVGRAEARLGREPKVIVSPVELDRFLGLG